MNINKTFIVIPAKDEASRIGDVLKKVIELGYRHIVVVDDGSVDNTREVARFHGVTVLRHLVNLGAGAATQTGIEYALRQGAEIVVTIDGDHQHLPDDIENLVTTLLDQNVDVVIGSRFFGNNKEIPLIRTFYNKVGNFVTWCFTGLWVTDSQSGMKAFHSDFVKKATITRNGYEFCIEMIRHIKLLKATWHETPISVVYTKDTMSKGQGFFTGLKMVFNMMR